MNTAPPQAPGFNTHHSASPIPTFSPPAPSINQSSDSEAELLHRLYNFHLPAADITRVVMIMNGRGESSVEDAHLLGRLAALNVPNGDINLIVDAMQRRDQGSGVVLSAYAPPDYDFKAR
jgi:hypothetical protein